MNTKEVEMEIIYKVIKKELHTKVANNKKDETIIKKQKNLELSDYRINNNNNRIFCFSFTYYNIKKLRYI